MIKTMGVFMKKWQLNEAKTTLEKLVDSALHGEIQEIVKPNGELVYLVSAARYNAMTTKKSFKEMLLSMPRTEDDEDLFIRAQGKARDIEL